MDNTSVLSKTGKGLLHLKYNSHQLLAVEFRVLKLIDGKTQVGDLIRKSPMNEEALLNVLKGLIDGSLVREVTSAVAVDSRNAIIRPVPMSEGDLDFTQSHGSARPFKPRSC